MSFVGILNGYIFKKWQKRRQGSYLNGLRHEARGWHSCKFPTIRCMIFKMPLCSCCVYNCTPWFCPVTLEHGRLEQTTEGTSVPGLGGRVTRHWRQPAKNSSTVINSFKIIIKELVD